MVAIHSRGDAGGRETEMRDAGDVREQMKGRVAPGRACERAFYADQQRRPDRLHIDFIY
jgi:hypothetical protein